MKLLPYLEQHFGITRPGDATWSHAVNDTGKLARFLKNPAAMFIESDIRLSIARRAAVAVHPPETESDLTYEALISAVRTSNQPLKLDFKDPEILVACLELLDRQPLPMPVLLNADILQGNGANPSKFSAAGFMALCDKYYPHGILSIGWTTTADPSKPYTAQNIDDMLALTAGDPREITFPVRANLLRNSWEHLSRLLAERPGSTLASGTMRT